MNSRDYHDNVHRGISGGSKVHDRGFWRKFWSLGRVTMILCLGITYVAISTYTLGLGVAKLRQTRAVSGFLPPSDRGTIEAVVCDVLGNRVPGARIEILDARTATDKFGRFRVENVPIGSVDLLIKAAGFEDATIRILVEPGINYPRINHDTGLWPVDFYIRFHAITNSLDDADTRLLFGLVEIVNPGKESFFVSQIEVRNPHGQLVYDLLESKEVLNHISQTYNLEVVTEPVPAYILQPGAVLSLELQALPNPLKGDYHLWLAYATATGHGEGKFLVAHIADEMDFDPDLDPHTP